MLSIREEQAIAKLQEFIEYYDISCVEDIFQRDAINEQCVDLVADLVGILLG